MKSVNEKLTAAEIAAITAGVHFGADFCARDVSTDTRTLQTGDLFIALRGENFRGEDFLPIAKEKGAVAAIVSEKQNIDLPQIIVSDTLSALTQLAADRRRRSPAQFFAITGTNGKTSTKEMLQAILKQKGQTLATRGNLNNDIGVPLTLLRLRAEDQFAVIEMGANHRGEIAHLTKLTSPDVALVTNVSAAHLAGFGSLAGVIETKREIYDCSAGAVVINLDLPETRPWKLAFASREMATFSLQDTSATVFASEIAADGSAFTLHLEGQAQSWPIQWQLQGRHNVANALAACAAARFAGVSGAQMQAALSGLVLHQSRLSAYAIGEHTLFDDTYNANPASFFAAIDVLKVHVRSLLIAGTMAELGDNAAALHRRVGEYAAESGLNEFWAVGADLAQAYLDGFPAGRYFPDAKSAGEALKVYLQDAAPLTVLVKGSRSARMEEVFRAAELVEFIKKG